MSRTPTNEVSLRYLSLFSGIEAATVAWKPLGWEPVAFCEYSPFPSAVLNHHYPGIKNFGDITQIKESDIKALGKIDLVVFGSPCQDLSVCGNREGFNGEKSGLFRTAIKIIKWCIKHCETRFALWENVVGSFSSNEGRDFSEVLSSLCGAKLEKPQKWSTSGAAYGKRGLVEWCVFDAQYFGVPQRRRRVFVFADFGEWSNRQPIFLNERNQAFLSESCDEEGNKNVSEIQESIGVLASPSKVFNTLLASHGRTQFSANQDLRGAYHVCYPASGKVRRLTPLECDRLMGFPDNYTQIPWFAKPLVECPDSHRIAAIGNSMAVPVMEFIGNSIQQELLRFGYIKD